MRIALKFAYDGRNFHGFARQPNLKTIEGELIEIFQSHGFIEDFVNARFRSASRTDGGVSALGNVVAFNTNSTKSSLLKKLLVKTKNEDIFIYGIKEVDLDFYPRFAKWRIYSYYLKKDKVDFERAISVASVFIGEHDFRNFAKVEADKNPLRSIDNIVINEEDDFFVIDFYAQTFLWNQVRRIVSAIEKVGNGKLTKKQVSDALNNPGKKVDFGLSPPEPLILKDVLYDFEFEYIKNYQIKLEKFEKRIASL